VGPLELPSVTHWQPRCTWQRVLYVLNSALALCYCACCTYHHAASVISTEESPTWPEMKILCGAGRSPCYSLRGVEAEDLRGDEDVAAGFYRSRAGKFVFSD
jgi:hypothetical protein